jgi:hypothetical protein
VPRPCRLPYLRRRIRTPPIYECRFIAAENSKRYELARCASRVAQRAGARIEGVSKLSTTLRTNRSRQRHWLPRPSNLGPDGREEGPGKDVRMALPRRFAKDGEFVLCKRNRLCYTQPRANDWFALFLGSSAVEHPTVNRMVAGSNPARGAKFRFIFNRLLAYADAAPDLARSVSQRRLGPTESRSSGCVWGGGTVATQTAPNRLNSSRA